jgi:plastocyanin
MIDFEFLCRPDAARNIWRTPTITANVDVRHEANRAPPISQEDFENMSLRITTILSLSIGLAACGGYNAPSAPSGTPTPAPAGSTTVTISSGASAQTTAAFGANPLTIPAGTTISWLNNDNTTHTSTADGPQWSSGDIPPGGRFNFAFATPGRFTYRCQIHPNMVGTIVVQ